MFKINYFLDQSWNVFTHVHTHKLEQNGSCCHRNHPRPSHNTKHGRTEWLCRLELEVDALQSVRIIYSTALNTLLESAVSSIPAAPIKVRKRFRQHSGPDLETERQTLRLSSQCLIRLHCIQKCFPLTRNVWSQDPEENAVPSGETRRVLTLFSCPNKMDTRVPFKTSHTLIV